MNRSDCTQSVSPVQAWSTLAVLVLLGMVAFLDRQVISLLVEPIKAGLHISDTQISLLQGLAFGLLYATCGLPIGHLVDHHSRRHVIFFGIMLWGLAASACGLATSFGTLLSARIFVGLGEAALAPASYSILSDLFDKRRLALALSIYSIGSALGSAAALVISSLLIAALPHGFTVPLVGPLASWRAVLFLTGLPALIFGFLIFLVPDPREESGGAARRSGATWADLLGFIGQQRAFFAAHLSGFACLIALAYAGLSWLPTVLIRSFAWPIGEVGLVLGGFTTVTGIAGLLLNGSLVDRLFARGRADAHLRYYLVAAPLMAVGGLAAGFSGSAPLFLAMMILPQILANFGGVAAAAVQIVTPPALRGKMSALYLMIVSLFGLMVGPSAVALLSDHVVGPAHLQLALGIVYALLSPIAGICFALGRGPMRRAVAAAAG